jgi:autotransporter-associated beta strand protein
VIKTGTGTVTFTGANTYTGGTVVNGGTLTMAAAATGGNYSIHPGGTLAFSAGSSFSQTAATTINGTGTLKLDSNIVFGTAQTITTAMSSAGLIWVTDNAVVTGSSTNRGRWDTNQASLQVDAGAEINFVEAGSSTSDLTVRVNALTGAGTVRAGYNSTRTLVVGVAGGSGNFAGTLRDRIDDSIHRLSLTKNGAGTQTLSGTNNTYTGVTTFTGGILNVANLSDYGVAGSLGARAAGQEVATNIGLRFMGGTLQYTGSTPQSTNRQIRIGTAGGTIDASGSTPEATLSFTHSGTNTDLFDSPGIRTLTLTGTNPGANSFAIALENQASNATSLTKSGPGTWILTGNSSYTGATNVNDGVLRIASVNALGGTAGNTVVPGGASPTSRLELTGGLVFPAEPLLLGARQGAAADAPHLGNSSGNNEWTGPITTTTGGANYNIESQAGLLTISGSISLSQTGTRVLQLMGAGNGVVSGVISGVVGNDARVTKKGGHLDPCQYQHLHRSHHHQRRHPCSRCVGRHRCQHLARHRRRGGTRHHRQGQPHAAGQRHHRDQWQHRHLRSHRRRRPNARDQHRSRHLQRHRHPQRARLCPGELRNTERCSLRFRHAAGGLQPGL